MSDDKVSEVVQATGRLQIRLAVAKGDRNNHRQIIRYIERDGTVTNTHRQRVGTVELGD